MWYSFLINRLLITVKPGQRITAKHFVQDLLFQIQCSSDDNQLPPEFLLGVIDKAYAKFYHLDNGSIDATYFNRYILGLIIVYIKNTDEQSNYNSDFVEFFLARLLDLDIYEEFQLLALDYKEGVRRFTSKHSLTATEKAACFIMKGLERQVLQKLEYQLTINLPHLSRIFLSAQSPKVIYSFCQQMSLLPNRHKSFNHFIIHIWFLGFANANVDEVIAKYQFLDDNQSIKPSGRWVDKYWSSVLFDELIKKIYPHEQQIVKNFVDELIIKSDLIFNDQDFELELQLLAGVIIQVYKQFGDDPQYSLSGSVFSQYLFGLILIGIDTINLNMSAITLFLGNKALLDPYNLFATAQSSYEKKLTISGPQCSCDVYLNKDSELASEPRPESDFEVEFCYCHSYSSSQIAAFVIINTLKRRIFESLKDDLQVDLLDLVPICRKNWSFELVYSLYQCLSLCKNTNHLFNDFIRQIGSLLISPSRPYPIVSFFSKPMIEVSYENTPHIVIEEPVVFSESPSG